MMCYSFPKENRTALGDCQLSGRMGEVVVLSLPDGELFLEVREGIELVRSIELLVVLAVTALDLAIVPRRERPDQFMADPEL